MFNVPSKSFKPCNKVMTISEHFYLQVFLGQTFLYFNFQSSKRGVFQIATKHQRLSFHKNKQIFSVSIINVSTQS